MDQLSTLEWQRHGTMITQGLSSFLKKEKCTDATLACEDGFFPVHKLVLSICSNYFCKVFEKTPCKSPVVVLKGVKQKDLNILLNFMYLGKVDVYQRDLKRVVETAEFLQVKGFIGPSSDEHEVSAGHKADHSPPRKRKKSDKEYQSSQNYEDDQSFNFRGDVENSGKSRLPMSATSDKTGLFSANTTGTPKCSEARKINQNNSNLNSVEETQAKTDFRKLSSLLDESIRARMANCSPWGSPNPSSPQTISTMKADEDNFQIFACENHSEDDLTDFPMEDNENSSQVLENKSQWSEYGEAESNNLMLPLTPEREPINHPNSVIKTYCLSSKTYYIHDDFRFLKRKTQGDILYLKCSVKDCPGGAKVLERDGVWVKFLATRAHSHKPDPAVIQNTQMENEFHEAIMNGCTEPENLFDELSRKYTSNTLLYENLKRRQRRRIQKATPIGPRPKDIFKV